MPRASTGMTDHPLAAYKIAAACVLLASFALERKCTRSLSEDSCICVPKLAPLHYRLCNITTVCARNIAGSCSNAYRFLATQAACCVAPQSASVYKPFLSKTLRKLPECAKARANEFVSCAHLFPARETRSAYGCPRDFSITSWCGEMRATSPNSSARNLVTSSIVSTPTSDFRSSTIGKRRTPLDRMCQIAS